MKTNGIDVTDSVIRFKAQVWAVKTLVDGGLQFVFAVDESTTMQAAQLMECKRFGAILDVTAEPLINNKDTTEDAVSARSKRKSSWQTAEN